MHDQAGGLRNLFKKEKIEKESSAKEKLCRVVCITSGKGGVGKTNLSVNLSLALVQKEFNVILFDADLGLANVDILIGAYSNYNLQNVLSGEKTLKEIMVKEPNGLKVIPGGSGIERLADIGREQQDSFIKQLSELEKEADFIIIDTSAGLSRSVLQFISSAHEVVVVTTPEPTSIADAYSIVKVISSYKLHSKVKLVINRVRTEKEAKDVMEKLDAVAQKYLNVDLVYLGRLLDDPQVVQAVKKQEPFILSFPNSKVSESIRHIALNLVDFSADEETKKGLGGFVSKIARFFS